MTGKTKPSKTVVPPSVGKTKVVAKVTDPAEPDKAAAMASMALRPSVNAAAVVVEYSKALGNQDVGALVTALSDSIDDAWAGDMKRAEAMLYCQAQALQSIFMSFSRRALTQEYQKNLESFLRLALKAQNQCRATLETLANIKNPPVVFARQANINNGGQQQVNNGPAAAGAVPAGAHAGNSQNDRTELLEASNGEWLDTGAAGTAGGADPHLETVGAIDRPALREGQSPGVSKR